jgi:hypothetical protein
MYHHTNVDTKDFNFNNFQRGNKQVSQFGDGLNASSNTTSFLVSRYGKPIQGEVNDADFVKIDASKTEKEVYEELKKQGYIFSEVHDTNDVLSEVPGAAMELFTDFQKSNPNVKGVRVSNHIIGNTKVAPFYVIYDAKSLYGQGALSKKIEQESNAELAALESKPKINLEAKKAETERRRIEDLQKGQLFLMNDGTYGGSRLVSLEEYSTIQIQENNLDSDVTKWDYNTFNDTGIFVNLSLGVAYIVPNNSYNGKKAEVVKVFINKTTKRFDLSNPRIINTPNIELVAKAANIDSKELYNEVLNAITKYDAELKALKDKKSQAVTTNVESEKAKKADIEKLTKEESFPIGSKHQGKESGDFLVVIGYTKEGVRFEVQTEGNIKPKRNESYDNLKRLVKEGKLILDEELKALEQQSALATNTVENKPKTKRKLNDNC